MRKNYLFGLAFLLFTSCSNMMNNDKGSLVVSNNNESYSAIISSVYVKEESSSGYVLVYSGEIENNNSYFIELEKGKYSVRIGVSRCIEGFKLPETFYTTGYNIYKSLESNGLYVAFDGKGIFFE